MKKVKLHESFQQTFQRSSKDCVYMIINGEVPVVNRSFHLTTGDQIDDAVRSILQRDHVHIVSWGAKRIRFGHSWNTFPDIMRKINSESIYRQYYKEQSLGVALFRQNAFACNRFSTFLTCLPEERWLERVASTLLWEYC